MNDLFVTEVQISSCNLRDLTENCTLIGIADDFIHCFPFSEA